MNFISIGGEFEINPIFLDSTIRYLNQFNYDFNWFSSGRSAFLAVLKHLKKKSNLKKILLPEYLCESLVKTALNAGIDIDFYQLEKNLHIDFSKINLNIRNQCQESLLLINYFGMLNLKPDFILLKKEYPNLILIEDQVQSLKKMDQPIDSDFQFNSFRKIVPVSDGAVVLTKEAIQLVPETENFFWKNKLLGSITKYLKKYENIQDQIYLNFFQSGEELLDQETLPSNISDASKMILNNTYFHQAIKQRLENYNYLSELLRDFQLNFIENESMDNPPLVLPIMLRNRDEIRKKFFENQIFLPIHWPINHLTSHLKKALFFSNFELSLIIDQRYDKHHMDIIASLLKKFKPDGIPYENI